MIFPVKFSLKTFKGQLLPHTCAENGTVLEKYAFTNESTCEGFACSMDTSFANDWGLLCDREYERNQLPGYFFIASSIGTLCSGVIFDKFGRRNGTMFYYISSLVVYVTMAFAQEFLIFKVCYSLLGFLTCGIGHYTLPIELSKNSWKWVVGTTSTISWTCGNLWMILCTFFIRDWRLALKVKSESYVIVNYKLKGHLLAFVVNPCPTVSSSRIAKMAYQKRQNRCCNSLDEANSC